MELIYRRTQQPVRILCDADWASDNTDRKSYSGMTVLLAGATVSWHARKQHSTALSSVESEYISLTETAKEVVWLRGLMKELQLSELIGDPTPVLMDSTGAMNMATNQMTSELSKHIDVRHHYIRQLVERKEIKLEYIRTRDNTADVMTKGLPGRRFK